MKTSSALCLILPALLVTGCPFNQYVIDLTPRQKGIERKLLFYRQDGADTNGAPNYRAFPPAELAQITQLYPPGGVTHDGDRHTATGDFARSLPPDVGGAGSYTNVATTLGSAGFYLERFRGDDDVAGATAKRLRAADQLADLVLGWSRMEFRHERGYKNLRQFLDSDFRRDLRNLSLYWWMLQTAQATRSEAPEEFAVRFGQYLAERGYLRMEELPDLFRMSVDSDPRPLMAMIQRLVASKLGVPKSAPMPRSLAFLADPDQMSKSWEKYLSTTDRYRARLRQWEKEKIVRKIGVAGQRLRGLYDPRYRTNSTAASTPGPQVPMPSAVADELTDELLEFDIFATDDHLTVRLSLPCPPSRSNGKWDPARKQVVWNSELETEGKGGRVPAFCYANWSQPDETAQTRHFGKVVLSGDDLSQYCLWHGALDKKEAAQWEALLARLQPGPELTNNIQAFRFAGEPVSRPTNGQPPSTGPSDFPRQLLNSALEAAERESAGTNHP
jgi:hypothetical protein